MLARGPDDQERLLAAAAEVDERERRLRSRIAAVEAERAALARKVAAQRGAAGLASSTRAHRASELEQQQQAVAQARLAVEHAQRQTGAPGLELADGPAAELAGVTAGGRVQQEVAAGLAGREAAWVQPTDGSGLAEWVEAAGRAVRALGVPEMEQLDLAGVQLRRSGVPMGSDNPKRANGRVVRVTLVVSPGEASSVLRCAGSGIELEFVASEPGLAVVSWADERCVWSGSLATGQLLVLAWWADPRQRARYAQGLGLPADAAEGLLDQIVLERDEWASRANAALEEGIPVGLAGLVEEGLFERVCAAAGTLLHGWWSTVEEGARPIGVIQRIIGLQAARLGAKGRTRVLLCRMGRAVCQAVGQLEGGLSCFHLLESGSAAPGCPLDGLLEPNQLLVASRPIPAEWVVQPPLVLGVWYGLISRAAARQFEAAVLGIAHEVQISGLAGSRQVMIGFVLPEASAADCELSASGSELELECPKLALEPTVVQLPFRCSGCMSAQFDKASHELLVTIRES